MPAQGLIQDSPSHAAFQSSRRVSRFMGNDTDHAPARCFAQMRWSALANEGYAGHDRPVRRAKPVVAGRARTGVDNGRTGSVAASGVEAGHEDGAAGPGGTAAAGDETQNSTYVRPVRAWCLCVRASDTRLEALAYINRAHAVQERAPHTITLFSETIRRLTKPVSIDCRGSTGGGRRTDGVRPGWWSTGSRRAPAGRAALRAVVGKRGKRVPYVWSPTMIDPNGFGGRGADAHWGTLWQYLHERVEDGEEITVARCRGMCGGGADCVSRMELRVSGEECGAARSGQDEGGASGDGGARTIEVGTTGETTGCWMIRAWRRRRVAGAGAGGGWCAGAGAGSGVHGGRAAVCEPTCGRIVAGWITCRPAVTCMY